MNWTDTTKAVRQRNFLRRRRSKKGDDGRGASCRRSTNVGSNITRMGEDSSRTDQTKIERGEGGIKATNHLLSR